MIRNRILLKCVAVFLIVETLINAVAPTISWALTAGPTAPEATSFEPVDTTDMVNLSSGDFVYSIPLLEVPGPSGGYPLSLAYHAGIQPGEEASWTGLGWTLNPGAITRNVNGFPDDHKNVNTTDRVFWEGGVTQSYSVGVSVGIKGAADVGVNLAFSKDTYKGVGVGVALSVGPAIGQMGYSASVGVTPYGQPTLSVGNEGSGGNISVNTDFETVGVNVGAGGSSVGFSTDFNTSNVNWSTGISLASNKRGGSFGTGGGGASVINGKRNKLTTQSENLGVSIPIYAVTVSLGYNYMRYFIDQTEKVATNGSLYTPSTAISNFDTRAYDSYSLLPPELSSATHPDPNLTAGASFLSYDDYSVNAQGISGSMRPYQYKALILRQNKKDDEIYQIKQYPFATSDYRSEQAQFRFVNDFSNKNLNEGGGWSPQTSRLETSYGTSQTGENGNDGIAGNHLAGSRHIEWYTNAHILGTDASKNPLSQGLIDCSASGFDRASAPPDQIGAFKITNESGLTYHFALPVYAHDEYQYSENIKRPDGLTKNEFKKPEKYAYTWFLTAITGPDYVDRGGSNGAPNHVADEDDWGYWVSFEYGKWTDNYAWRNPDQGYHEDIDLNFRNYSSGKKELYYLDAIKTKTHTAVFVKEIRVDAKSSSVAINLQKKSDIGFFPSDYSETFNKKVYEESPCADGYLPADFTATTTAVAHRTYPVSTLKLKKIYLFENNVLDKEVLEPNGLATVNSLKSVGTNHEFDINFTKDVNETQHSFRCPLGTPAAEQCGCDWDESTDNEERTESATIFLHLPKNVFDVDDLTNLEDDFNNATRALDLETDYSLVPETPNSFNHPALYGDQSTPIEDYTYYGKLTLKAIHFIGKNGKKNLVPPITFKYDYLHPKTGVGSITSNEGDRVYKYNQEGSTLEPGDILTFTSADTTYYALVQSIVDDVHTLRMLGKHLPALGVITWKETKNPPYNKDHYDVWGLYKPDYNDPNSRSINRYTTPTSAKSVDVWSLREIGTSLGSTISMEYEADTYRKSIMSNGSALIVNSVTFVSPFPEDETSAKFLLQVNTEGKDLRDIYAPNSYLQCFLPYSHYVTTGSTTLRETGFLVGGNITAVTTNTIEVVLAPWAHNAEESFINTYYGGNIFYNSNYENIGGGFRVKSISINDVFNGSIKSLNYDYSHDGLTTGVTSYEPNIVQKMTLTLGDEQSTKFANLINFQRFENIFQSAREIPAPGVMYESVSIKESIKKGNLTSEGFNYTQYKFQILHENMLGFQINGNNVTNVDDNYGGIHFQKVVKKDLALKDYTSWIGKLKSVTTFDRLGNKISETVNRYLHDQIEGYDQMTLNQAVTAYDALIDDYSNLGLIQESSWSGKFVKDANQYQLFGVVSHRHAFPAIQTGQTSVNFKTGISSTTENRAFDFYSGEVISSVTTDVHGNSYVTDITPAYRKYPGMGLALDGGKNMLTQEASSFVYKADVADEYKPIGLVSASIQTWSDQIHSLAPGQSLPEADPQLGIWRKHATYTFIGDNSTREGDGLFPIVNNLLPTFSAWSINSAIPAGWQKNGEVSLYDVHSHPLEARDLNGQYAATKMSFDQTRVMTTAAFAEYREFGYSGAEERPADDAFGSDVVQNSTTYAPIAHTGAKALSVASGSRGFTFFMVPKQRTYQVSVWSSQPTATFKYKLDNNNPPIAAPYKNVGEAGSWHLLEAVIPITESWDSIEIWCEANGTTTYFDDFRVHPFNSAMTSYVYNQWGELSHILDNNNLYTEYEYDEMGRLTHTYKESFQFDRTKTSKTIYHYAGQE